MAEALRPPRDRRPSGGEPETTIALESDTIVAYAGRAIGGSARHEVFTLPSVVAGEANDA